MLTSWPITLIMKRDCGNILAMKQLRGHLPDIETAHQTQQSQCAVLDGHDRLMIVTQEQLVNMKNPTKKCVTVSQCVLDGHAGDCNILKNSWQILRILLKLV